MIDKEALQIRQQADQAAIGRLLAEAPCGRDIGPREPGSVTTPQSLLEKLPRDLSKRRAQLERELISYRHALRRDIRRYEQIRLGGLASLSAYDLVIAFSGDALAACRCSLELKDAHISYNRSMIEALEAALAVLEGERDKQRFAAAERVKVALPVQKAFIVRKWADAAQTPFKTVESRATRQPAVGLTMIDARLPAHQAFIVKKWADSLSSSQKNNG
jgi:hypothetical protein